MDYKIKGLSRCVPPRPPYFNVGEFFVKAPGVQIKSKGSQAGHTFPNIEIGAAGGERCSSLPTSPLIF